MLAENFSMLADPNGFSSVLNPKGRYYTRLKECLRQEYEDNYWAEDAIFMERNSRDFVSRIERININAEAIAQTLNIHPRGMHRRVLSQDISLIVMKSKRCTIQSIVLHESTMTGVVQPTVATVDCYLLHSTPPPMRRASSTF